MNAKFYLNDAYQRIVKLLIRVALALFFFIVGFELSNGLLVQAQPLLGVHYLAEILVALVSAFIGFFYIPVLGRRVKDWLETLIRETVANIVSNFWELQSRRIQEARRDKQKQKSKENEKKIREQISDGIVLDTSVLIDGRILDIVKTGFIDNLLIIPTFVINELHTISDSDDTLKRQKGRRGLDVVNDLKKLTKVIIPNSETPTKSGGVDADLVKFAKNYKVKLMTLDFNLNKVAQTSGLKVLNINELANSVKTVILPGERLNVKIVQPGKEKQQGVGYFDDGTMIVVEGARDMVGEEVPAKVSRVIQTNAGKMIFSNLE
ncbi:MAG TPA: TRAM domain-containing protein [Candidatus Saccharimonadales bacterium]|nr:TRAM domain-containing protein [Candidatus Saccharimonadales bacterium]